MRYELTINREPFGKQEKRVTRRGKFSHSYLPAESRNLMDDIATEFKLKYPNHELLKKEVCFQLLCFYPLKKRYKIEANKYATVTKKVRENIGVIRPLTKPDLSNVLKLVEDALSGVCYVDDSQITDVIVSKRYSENPRMCICISTEGLNE